MTRPRRFALAALLALAAALAFGCGGGAKPAAPSAAVDVDADPVVLLPAGPLAVLTVDARAILADERLGKPVLALVDRLVPLGEESGFSPSRDVDRVTVGSYSLEGVDAAGVVSGRFDVEKIALAAKNHTPTKSGGPLVETKYSEHSIYTVANVGFAIVSPKTVLVGTDTAIRRSLDRLKNGSAKRDMPPWMADTLGTKGAAFALAADLASQNLAQMALGPISLGFTKGLRVVRVVGNLAGGNVNVAGTATWADAAGAAAGADALRGLTKLANQFATVGLVPRLQDLKIEPLQSDVQVTFTVEGSQLASVLGKVAQYM